MAYFRTTSWCRAIPLGAVKKAEGPHYKRMRRRDLEEDEHVRPGSVVDGAEIERLKPGLLKRLMPRLVPADDPKHAVLEGGNKTLVHTSVDEADTGIGTTSGTAIEELPGDEPAAEEPAAEEPATEEKKPAKKPPGGK